MSELDEAGQRAFFERLAARYDNRRWRDRWPRNQEWKAETLVAEFVTVPEGGAVVELGCGTGQIARLLLERRPDLRYLGLDLSRSMLDVAAARLAPVRDRVRLEVV